MKAITDHIFELAQQIAGRIPGFPKHISPGDMIVYGGRSANPLFK